MLNQPTRSKPPAAAMARSKAMALAGLIEMLFARGGTELRRPVLRFSNAAGFVRVAVSENLVAESVSFEALRALLAPDIPQASKDMMTTNEI
jgi:hypothetical protein